MKQYVNFYENIPEALKRINQTVVFYDGEPKYVIAVTNHKTDGIFRVYLVDTWHPKGFVVNMENFPPICNTAADNPIIGELLDKWMEIYPNQERLIRKQMNSPLFRKFRPFPLGMCNLNGNVIHIERSPTRRTEQGLTSGMLSQTHLSIIKNNNEIRLGVDLRSEEFLACIKGDYPSLDECFLALNNPDIANVGVAFHRQFALIRGPIGIIFLAYKNDIIGVFPNSDKSLLRLGDNFKYLREVIEINCNFERIV